MKTPSQIEDEKITVGILGCMIPLFLLGCLFAWDMLCETAKKDMK